MPGIELGPYTLDRVIGRGGMAVVWGARWNGPAPHRRPPMAIKVITPDRVSAARQAALRRELRALARLSHPGIMSVLDHGTVPEPTPSPELPAGSPYLVMPLAEGGSLDGRTLTWFDTRRVMLALLSALAHAHARGVLHRDIKPANVLFGSSDDPNHVLLGDFGVATALGYGERGTLAVAGTPRFMAPEQFAGAWREFGPWTDLFSVGRLATALLAAGAVVPTGFEAWTLRLTAHAPADRFRAAADAAWEFQHLGRPSRVSTLDSEVSAPTFAATRLLDGLLLPDIATVSEAPASLAPVRPLTEDWRVPGEPEPKPSAALSLFDLRQPILTGRDEERDVLWTALRRAHRGGRPQGVLVHGPPGAGKTRMCGWIAKRAHELGAAMQMSAAAHADAPFGHTIRDVILGFLRCRDLIGDALRRRLREIVSAWRLPIELIGQVSGLAHGTWAEVDEHDAATQVLRALAHERPIVLTIDDLHHDRSAARFVGRLLALDDIPVLVVATAPERGGLPEPLQAATDCLILADHRPDELSHILRQLLPLGDTLASQIGAYAGGSPARAIDILRRMVRKEQLSWTSAGWILSDDVDAGNSAHGLDDDCLLAVRLLALAGGSLTEAAWRELVASAEGVWTDGIPETLAARGLGEWLEGPGTRFALASPSVGQQAMGSASDPDIVRTLHRVVLARRVAEDPGESAQHLQAMGLGDEARAALLDGADWAIHRGHHDRADQRLSSLAHIPAAPGGCPSDARELLAWALVHIGRGQLVEAARAAQALGFAPQIEMTPWYGMEHWIRGRVLLLQGHSAPAVRCLRRGLQMGRRTARSLLRARCALDLAKVYTHHRDTAAALELLDESIHHYRCVGHTSGLGAALFATVGLECEAGSLERAIRLLPETLEIGGQLGDSVSWADGLQLAGEVARRSGDLSQAEHYYRQAAEAYRVHSRLGGAALMLLNLAVVRSELGDAGSAAKFADGALRWYREHAQELLAQACHAVALWPAAVLGDRAAFREHLAAVQGMPQPSKGDLLDALTRALHAAEQANWTSEAKVLSELV
jgi:eukaryotic-like serine/threonine-protein kinase